MNKDEREKQARKEQMKKLADEIGGHLQQLAQDRCPTCGKVIAWKERKGFVSYAKPCGHRLGLLEK